jgi:hypothetical protein
MLQNRSWLRFSPSGLWCTWLHSKLCSKLLVLLQARSRSSCSVFFLCDMCSVLHLHMDGLLATVHTMECGNMTCCEGMLAPTTPAGWEPVSRQFLLLGPLQALLLATADPGLQQLACTVDSSCYFATVGVVCCCLGFAARRPWWGGSSLHACSGCQCGGKGGIRRDWGGAVERGGEGHPAEVWNGPSRVQCSDKFGWGWAARARASCCAVCVVPTALCMQARRQQVRVAGQRQSHNACAHQCIVLGGKHAGMCTGWGRLGLVECARAPSSTVFGGVCRVLNRLSSQLYLRWWHAPCAMPASAVAGHACSAVLRGLGQGEAAGGGSDFPQPPVVECAASRTCLHPCTPAASDRATCESVTCGRASALQSPSAG